MKPTAPPRNKPPKFLKRDSNLEARFQAAIVEYVRRVTHPDTLIFHVPNGGPGRSLSRLKWIGAIAGITDLVIVDRHGLAYFAEIKPPDTGLEDKQEDFRDYCRKTRKPWALWTTVNDAERDLIKWGFELRGRVTT